MTPKVNVETDFMGKTTITPLALNETNLPISKTALLRFMQNTPSKSGKQEHALLGDECPLVFFGFEYSL